MGDATAGPAIARAGAVRTQATQARRRRAVGTRDRIISHLSAIDEIADPAGMASARLAEAVGYPGSSVAFAQLLSGMERDGLITRDVRGKRTYRIALVDAPAGDPVLRPVVTGRRPEPRPEPLSAVFGGAIDYDELARRVVAHVLRRLSELDEAEFAALERLLVSERKSA